MIRFIDLGDQILEGQSEFAWWDTISDSFEEFSGNQTWPNWKCFEEDYLLDEVREMIQDMRPLDRYKSLFPRDWSGTFVSAEDRKKRYEKGICDDIIDEDT
ncbi:MAG: hypothetical protein E3J76_04845 [Candidatus Aminicenantes bacterium]|nr:MAG: hypothetical protein E3J76_04845 [Candidatus Aminicenantes bacterium]